MTQQLFHIPNFENYLIDRDGNVYSIKNKHIIRMKPAGCKTREHRGVILRKDGKSYWRYIHRLMCETFKTAQIPQGLVVDHIDRNPLNNKLENLRIVMPTYNILNSAKASGVSYNKRQEVWSSYIMVEGKRIHLGYFKTREEAKTKRDQVHQKVLDSIVEDSDILPPEPLCSYQGQLTLK